VLATTIIFFAPLIYTTNQELIDAQLKHASDVVNAQTAQLRSVAQKHTEQATQVTKQYMGDYTAKAQSLIKTAQQKSPLKASDFPAAPKEDLKASAATDAEPTVEPAAKTEAEEEPLIAA
jgi:hypothetical protein